MEYLSEQVKASARVLAMELVTESVHSYMECRLALERLRGCLPA